MSSDNHDFELLGLYRDAANERSPASLDARILAAAAKHARVRRIHTRLRMLAIAAVVAGLAVTVPRWIRPDAVEPVDTVRAIDRHSPLADALRNLRVERLDASAVSSCLRRNDLCAQDAPIDN